MRVSGLLDTSSFLRRAPFASRRRGCLGAPRPPRSESGFYDDAPSRDCSESNESDEVRDVADGRDVAVDASQYAMGHGAHPDEMSKLAKFVGDVLFPES